MKWLYLLPVILMTTTAAQSAESVYTKLNLDKDCVFHSSYEQGASAYCKGYNGYPVHFSEGDLRQMVRFGHLGGLLGQWESFGQFNHVNDTIEWRLEGGKPYATILRWFIENTNQNGEVTEARKGQVLVISKVADTHNGNPVSCVVGYVDAKANSNANALARKVADTLGKTFRCIENTPAFHGVRGDLSGNPSSSFE